MKNMMKIDEYKAIVEYDPEIRMFRGAFLDLNGGADFYADTVEGLEKEGRISLEVYLEACAEAGIPPRKQYSGRFNLRLDPELHGAACLSAATDGKSLNEWVAQLIHDAVSATRPSGDCRS